MNVHLSVIDASIIVPTLGRLQLALNLSERLLQLSPNAKEIFLIFQDKSEFDQFLRKQKDSRISSILHNEKSAITARNKGLMLASSKYVAFIDDDCSPERQDWLEQLISPLEKNVKIGLVTGSVKGWSTASGQNFIFKKPFNTLPIILEPVGNPNFSRSVRCKSFAAGNFAVSRELMVRLSGFNPELGSPSIYEEIEFSKRLSKKTNSVIWFNHNASVIHNQLNFGGMRNESGIFNDKFIDAKRILLYKLVYGKGVMFFISKNLYNLRKLFSILYKKIYKND